MASLTVEEILSSARRRQKILFIWMALGVVACFAAMVSLQTIQTSINIEGNKGAIALTAGYIVSVLFGVFCCPLLLRFAGANGTLLIADITMFFFCLSNLSQELSILLVGAITGGVGRATLLPAYTIVTLDIAASSAKLSRTREERFYQDYYQSRFYTMLESVSIIGNLISYVILYGFEASNNLDATQPSASEAPIGYNISSTNVYENPYAYCGVNDCQDPEVVNESLDQYQPPDRTSIHILAFVAVSLSLSSIGIHAFVYPGVGRFSQRLQNIELKARRQSTAIELHEKEPKNGSVSSISSMIYSSEPNIKFDLQDDIHSNAATVAETDFISNRQTEESSASEGSDKSESFWKTLKNTGKFLLKPRAMMLNVSTLHHGMMLGFVYADVTRAYASCVAGVELTGLFAVMFGVTAMPTALIYGQLNFPHKRYFVYFASCVLEFGLYFLCYFWIPNSSDLWVVLLIFAGFGIVNGLFRQNIIAAYFIHFPTMRSVAFSVFCVFFTGGMGVQYGLSIVLCVRDTIYTQVAVLLSGVILFVMAEYIRHRNLMVRRYSIDDFEEDTTSTL